VEKNQSAYQAVDISAEIGSPQLDGRKSVDDSRTTISTSIPAISSLQAGCPSCRSTNSVSPSLPVCLYRLVILCQCLRFVLMILALYKFVCLSICSVTYLQDFR